MKTQFPGDSRFSGRLPAWKVNRAAEWSEAEGLAFSPSSHHRVEGQAKIDQIAGRPARQIYIFQMFILRIAGANIQ